MEFGHTFEVFAKKSIDNTDKSCASIWESISAVYGTYQLYIVETINQYITDFLFDELFEISKISI